MKATLSCSDLRISTQLLLSLSLDRRIRACTHVTKLGDFGTASSLMPPRERHLEKFSRSLIVYTTAREWTDGSRYYTPRTEFFLDKMISPGYFKDHFLDTFGPVSYVLEHCRICFSVFLFIGLIIDMVVMILRYMEIDTMTGSALGFGKTLLSASYSIFLSTSLTSMYIPRARVLAAFEQTEVGSYVEKDTHEVKETAKKKEEHLYPTMSTVRVPLSPV